MLQNVLPSKNVTFDYYIRSVFLAGVSLLMATCIIYVVNECRRRFCFLWPRGHVFVASVLCILRVF